MKMGNRRLKAFDRLGTRIQNAGSVAALEASRARRHTAVWQSAVSAKARFIRETPTAYVVLHPTKGYRWIGKRRLGEVR